MLNNSPDRVSIHGGHSGQFCCHAYDTLESIIGAYIVKGYAWVGITEHMPPNREEMILPEEADAGMDLQANYDRFADYIATCRHLQAKYADDITIYVGFETEAWSGYQAFLSKLMDTFQPDYIVGSVHHVHDVSIDFSTVYFQQAIEAAGGLDALYCDYFDLQYELITSFKPAVVGHMDLIRLLDDDYRQRMQKPDISSRIERNLSTVKDLDLILDFNLKALAKGQTEPYIARPILTRAREMGITVVPGDDVHRITDVDCFWDQGIQILDEVGLISDWRRPA